MTLTRVFRQALYFHSFRKSLLLHKRSVTTGGGKRKRLSEDIQRVRNALICAHIDAGKTTTTERMLFYSGMIDYPGEVHHGDTVTDFLPQERERGITIQSAVVSFPWQDDFRINLVDSPGHVDFTFEVERAVRAVDSSVTILDASAGVEAQTLTVWRQATECNLPRMIYLNKMDKGTASHTMCLDSIRKKLHATPILLQLPVYANVAPPTGKGSGIIGVTDLVQMERIVFDMESKGKLVKLANVQDDPVVRQARDDLVEEVSNWDSELAEIIIESESVTSVTAEQLHAAIKRVTLKKGIVPVLLGSSYKNVGVQLLLDAIVRYFPHPHELPERDPVIAAYGSDLCALAFKTIHDKQLGPLTYLRTYSGQIKASDRIFNVTKDKIEKVSKVYQPLGDDLKEVTDVGSGQIVMISGLKETVTGDTITSTMNVAKAVKKKLSKNADADIKPLITGLSVPEPVFFCSIEPASLSQQKLMEEALVNLQREDPSLKVHVDEESGQTILSGMGELHIEVIHDRLKTDYKVEADLGRLQVAYKESIMEPARKRIDFERKLADQLHKVTIEMSITPVSNSTWEFRKGKGKNAQENLAHLRDRHEQCIKNGVDSALRFGPKLGYPIIDVEVGLFDFLTTKNTSEVIIAAAAASCIRQMLEEIPVVILEPMMRLEVTVDERSQKPVHEDLNRRRMQLESIGLHQGNKVIIGQVPLAELMGYSTALRTLSSGYGTYSMQFSHYEKVINPLIEDKIVTYVRGF